MLDVGHKAKESQSVYSLRILFLVYAYREDYDNKQGACLMPQASVSRRFFHQAAVVVAAVAVATLLTFPLAAVMFNSRDLLFVAAVILVTRYEGSIEGICTAILSVLAFDWYFDMNPGVLDITFGNGVRIVVFISLSTMVAVLDRQRRRAMDSLVTTNEKLQTALDEIKTLRGTLLICSYCKKIETNPDTWIEVENYVRQHSEAEFNHGVCPVCLQKQMRRLG